VHDKTSRVRLIVTYWASSGMFKHACRRPIRERQLNCLSNRRIFNWFSAILSACDV